MKGDKAKTIAAELMNTAKDKIWINPEEAESLKEAITKDDIRGLIKEGIVKKSKQSQQSNVRSRKLRESKSKGRKKGAGSKRAGKKKRSEKKETWIKRVRAQRRTLRELKKSEPEAVEKAGYRRVYKMVKGNYFRGKRYLEKFIKEGASK